VERLLVALSHAILKKMLPPLLDSFRSQAEPIGFWAGSLTTISFAPQLVKAWKTGGEGLSWAMLALFGCGVGLWIVYGVLRVSPAIITANALTEAQVLAILVLKVRHDRESSNFPAAQISGLRAGEKTGLP
jgi:MtN3 and saliva related transmembrane protein